MPNFKLDNEEQEILEAFDSGKMQSIQNAKIEMEKHKKYASNTFKKDKRINIRLTYQ